VSMTAASAVTRTRRFIWAPESIGTAAHKATLIRVRVS
jgi:hypothetical protein